jgi:hypothetical protein
MQLQIVSSSVDAAPSFLSSFLILERIQAGFLRQSIIPLAKSAFVFENGNFNHGGHGVHRVEML